MNGVKAVSQERFPEGARHVMRIGDREILLIHERGKIYAVDNICPHMGQRLEEAQVTEDGFIVCPRHRSTFDLRTGEVKAWTPWPPGVGRVLGVFSKAKPLPVLDTRVEDGTIWVAVE